MVKRSEVEAKLKYEKIKIKGFQRQGEKDKFFKLQNRKVITSFQHVPASSSYPGAIGP